MDMETPNDELAETKTELQRVKEEMLQLRASSQEEMNQLREEVAKIRKEAGASAQGMNQWPEEECALGFKYCEFLSKTHTKSLQWIETTIAVCFKEEIQKYPSYFEGFKLLGSGKTTSVWTCAGFNRGGICHSKWHMHEKPGKRPNQTQKELRLHCCTLCYEGLGILSNHPVTGCPWIKSSTWRTIGEKD